MTQTNDRRTNEQRATHTHLIVGTDRFLSGWGEARCGASYAVWACDSVAMADRVLAWVESRSDMRRVRYVSERHRAYRPRGAAHVSVYVVIGWDGDRPITA